MDDLLVLGGLGVDVRVRVPALPLPAADSVTVDPIDLRIGNTGAGVALAAHALGLRVTVVDVLGADPAGDVVRAALARTGVQAVLAGAPAGTRRSVNLVDPAGRRSSLYDPRPWPGGTPFPAAELAALIRNAAHVHVSIMDWARDLLPAIRAALANGVTLSTDLHDWDGANPYHRPFAEAADLVFVSGVRLDDGADAVAAGLAPRTVVVTRGGDGADVYPAGGAPARVPAAAPPAPVVDTNGAGDAFAAGLIAARLRGAPLADAAAYAAHVSAAACTHDGMEYPPDLLPPPRFGPAFASAARAARAGQDGRMASTVEIPLVGGAADGQTVTVELDPNGRPPLTHHHLTDGGLAKAEIYELETVEARTDRWRYCWRGPAI